MSITRIDHKSTHGWFVRVTHGSKVHGTSKEVNALFSDIKCGGKAQALRMAEEHNEELKCIYPKLPFRLHPLTGSLNEVVGVTYTFKRNSPRHMKRYGYTVSTQVNGVQRSKFFSIARYGGEAFDKAVAYRREWERKEAEKLGVLLG